MILWTIQHQNAFDNLQKTGVLRTDEDHILWKEDFQFAYDWMASQMEEGIGPAPSNVKYPIWLWYEWEGIRKRPDMRSFGRYWAEKGTPIVLLTVDVPSHLIVLSDFDQWHIVLGNGYLALSKEEEKNPVLPKEKSWERIFDLSIRTEYWGLEENKSIQATTWEIRKEWVKKAETFIIR